MTTGKYEVAEMKKIMWECKPFKYLDSVSRQKRLKYIGDLMSKDSVAGIWEIRADKGEKRNVTGNMSGNSSVAGPNDGEVDAKVARTENSAPDGGHLDWEEPLHQDSGLEES